VEDGGETKSEDGSGHTERAHTVLDDKVGAEFEEKNAGRETGSGATSKGGRASNGVVHLFYEMAMRMGRW
jgi:hypothetical protein